MKLFEWLILTIITRLLSRPQQIMSLPPSESKPERAEMFRIGTTEYEIFCAHLAKAIVSRWRFKIEVVGASFLLLFAIASVVAGLMGSGLKSEVSEFTSKLKSDNEAKLAKDLISMDAAVNARLTAETEKLNKMIVTSFHQPNIQKTINDVAQTEAKTLLEEGVTPEINKFKATLISFTKKELEAAEALQNLEKELEVVKKRNHLTRLADAAISDGDLKAYLEIEQMSNRDPLSPSTPEYQAAHSEFIRILAAYSPLIKRHSGVTLKHNQESIDSLMTADEILTLLQEVNLALGRQRMAELLETKLQTLTFKQATMVASEIEKEENLLALQNLKRVFAKIKGSPDPYTRPGKDYVLEWWKANKERLEKEMKP
jgi:hypothetical protein